MKTPAKWFGALAAIAIVLLIIVAGFGTVESRLECPGQVQWETDAGPKVTAPATLYATVDTYRWFVFWFDRDAMIVWDIRPDGDAGFGYYDHQEFGMPIIDLRRTKQYGYLALPSNRIHIETASDGSETFDGICK